MPEIPRPLFEGYWQGYGQPGAGLALGEIATEAPVDVVKIAFYNLYPLNSVSVCFGMSEISWQDTAAGIKILHNAGCKVVASLIGSAVPAVSWAQITDPQAFAAFAKGLLIDNLGCDGIDLDMDGPQPPQGFNDIVKALRAELGPKGGDSSLLTAVLYQPQYDKTWLTAVGDQFDWITTMGYPWPFEEQKETWKTYAQWVGGENVVVGVSCGETSTDLGTVANVAKWETQLGAGKTGGMMLWHFTYRPWKKYYEAITQNLTIWRPPNASG